MRATAILNLKGGVGKTTTAINLAAILAKQHGKKVLLIDADSQCNTTEFTLSCVHPEFTTAHLLRTPANMMEGIGTRYFAETHIPGVDLIPADESLMDLDLSAVKAESVSVGNLKVLLSKAQSQVYDYVLIDCPPAFNAAAAAALIAADDVIIPIKLDAFSLRGMGNLMRQIKNMQQINPKLKVAGILPTMWYKSDRAVGAERMLSKSGLRVFPHIRSTKKVDDMTWEQTPIITCSPRSAAAIDYRQFVAAYIGGAKHGL